MLIGSFHNLEPRLEEYLNNLLMVAYQIVQDETCKKCGTPYWIGKSTLNYVEFNIEETNCYSCADLEATEEAASKKDRKAHGVTRYVMPKAAEGYELPTRTESYEKMGS